MKKISTNILLRLGRKNYRITKIDFAKDNSIYIYFPRREGWRVLAESDVETPVRGIKQIQLQKVSNDFDTPYLSYHVGSKCVHVNAKNGRFKSDVEILDMGADENFVFPLCQILFPIDILLYMDPYQPEDDSLAMTIFSDKSIPGVSVELWGHPSGGLLDIDSLPLHKQRINDGILDCKTFHSKDIFQYTCTAVITKHTCFVKKGIKPGIAISIPSENPYIFSLEPVSAIVEKRIKDVGRNDPCFCKSGRKYKNCCGR